MSRRLAQLSAELAATRAAPTPPEGPHGELPEQPVADEQAWWAEHTLESIPAVDRATSLPPVPSAVPVPPPSPADPPAVPALPPVVPVPGRHAARRRGSAAVLVPDTLRGRMALAPGPLAVVAVLVAVGLAVTCWWVVRGDSAESAGSLTAAPTGGLFASVVPAASSAAPGAAASGSASAGSVTVDVAGRVRRPGIAVLPAGSRVVDALEAAGGARRGVDLSGLNLARVLVDGEQILVGAPAPGGLLASAVPSPGSTGGPLVNLNVASQAELELLPDVGPVTAEAIIAWREQHGGFTAVEELLEVDGIGDATLTKLLPHVTV